jgi:para-nitrobenzyl esterase
MLVQGKPKSLASAAILAATVAGTAVVGTLDTANAHTKKPPSATVVQTTDGPVKGIQKAGVSAYLGIPYAAPPVGKLRWQPPQPPKKWKGVRSVTSYGATCVQTNTLGVFAKTSLSEDCLFLNVFVPDGRGRDAWDYFRNRRHLPVMVWIHGGGLFDGSANEYDPQWLATDGNVIVVSINYRLNVFGFLAHPALDSGGQAFANYGYMDQQFALKWVQKNIKAFGGDPKNVTIFGESAGGNSVFAAIASPTAKGLFHRAIAQSGSYVMNGTEQPITSARAYGQQFATAVGCVDQSAECLRALTPEQIVTRARAFTDRSVAAVDGVILKDTIAGSIQSGRINKVPLLNGGNRDEMTWFTGLVELGTGHVVTAAEYPARVAATHGAANAQRILARYPLSEYNSPSEALAAMDSSKIMLCTQARANREMAKYVPVYSFEFADRSAPSAGPLASFPYGAAHTFEIQYLFKDFHGATGTIVPLNTTQRALSRSMVSYWTTFARNGDPNSKATQEWKRYDSKKDNYQELQLRKSATTLDFSQRHKCDLWDSLAAGT